MNFSPKRQLCQLWPRPLFFALPLALCLLSACGSSDDDPTEVLKDYVTALEKGDTEKAFQLLSEGSRARLREKEAAWYAGSRALDIPRERPKPPHGDAGLAYYQARVAVAGSSGLPLLPKGSRDLLGEAVIDGPVAKIPIKTPRGESSVRMEKGPEGWRVALMF